MTSGASDSDVGTSNVSKLLTVPRPSFFFTAFNFDASRRASDASELSVPYTTITGNWIRFGSRIGASSGTPLS